MRFTFGLFGLLGLCVFASFVAAADSVAVHKATADNAGGYQLESGGSTPALRATQASVVGDDNEVGLSTEPDAQVQLTAVLETNAQANIAFVLRGYGGTALFDDEAAFRDEATEVMTYIRDLSFGNKFSYRLWNNGVDERTPEYLQFLDNIITLDAAANNWPSPDWDYVQNSSPVWLTPNEEQLALIAEVRAWMVEHQSPAIKWGEIAENASRYGELQSNVLRMGGGGANRYFQDLHMPQGFDPADYDITIIILNSASEFGLSGAQSSFEYWGVVAHDGSALQGRIAYVGYNSGATHSTRTAVHEAVHAFGMGTHDQDPNHIYPDYSVMAAGSLSIDTLPVKNRINLSWLPETTITTDFGLITDLKGATDINKKYLLEITPNHYGELYDSKLLVYEDRSGTMYFEAVSDLLDSDNDGAPNDCDTTCQSLGMVTDTDDDNDGMPDAYELANGLNPIDAIDAGLDNDGDGLSNFDEFRLGTDINLVDTDDDGINDDVDNNPLVFDEAAPTLYSGQFYTLTDITDDGVKEIGVLTVDIDEAKVRLQILNGKDRVALDEVVWADNYVDTTLSLHLIPDMNNNGVDEVGLFGIQDIQNNEGKPQMFVRDLKTGNKVGDVYNWVANWKEVSALVLADMSGDGIAEIAIQGRFEEGKRPQLVVKIGNTNTIMSTYSYPDLFVSPKYYQHSDIDGDGLEEIATFGRLVSNNKIQVKIASGLDAGSKKSAYNFPDKWDDISWHRLDDSNGDGQDDWGMFGTLREDGRPQLVNKDGVSPVGALRIYAWPAEMENAQFYRIPDMNNDGVDEVAAAGQRSNNGRYQFQIQDGTDRNVLLANHNLNLNLQSVTYHVLPDLSGDEKAEIGFMGVNQLGEYELVIRHGDTLNGEFATLNLGSDWQNAPAITSLGDTDDDGLPDLMVYGQNASAEQLVITSL